MKLDILVLAAHPDDAELSCSGTILAHVAKGMKVGIVDLTQGEMGTRGTIALRAEEAAAASKILGVTVRENLRFADAFFMNDEKHQLEVIRVIRKYRPQLVLANAVEERHPDHEKAAALAKTACFLSGLPKIKTKEQGVYQEAWRPHALYHYIQNFFIKPDFIVDISAFWEQKMEAVKAFKSQFYDPESKEPATYISTEKFIPSLEARAIELGHSIGVKYGEGFIAHKNFGIKNLFDLL